MKKHNYLILLLITATLSIANPAYAKRAKYGLGVMLGAPLGLSGAHYLKSGKMVDALISFSSGKEAFRIHSDYLIPSFEVMKIEGKFFHAYYGLGLKYVSGDGGHENELGVRIPGAIWTRMSTQPIEFSLEAAPVLNVIETTKLELDVGLIIRYIF